MDPKKESSKETDLNEPFIISISNGIALVSITASVCEKIFSSTKTLTYCFLLLFGF